MLIVPAGYTSGSYLTSSQTFNSQTFTSLGLVAGTYSYTWGTGSNAEILSVVVGGTASSEGGGGGGTGATGTGWYFYSDEGALNADPPINNGNVIFRLQESPQDETYNPNKDSGTGQLYFNRYDIDGVDYLTQFTNLQTNGGTLSITQNGKTATYTTTNPNMFIYVNNPPNDFLFVNTSLLTQTATASSPFVSGAPITLSFS